MLTATVAALLYFWEAPVVQRLQRLHCSQKVTRLIPAAADLSVKTWGSSIKTIKLYVLCQTESAHCFNGKRRLLCRSFKATHTHTHTVQHTHVHTHTVQHTHTHCVLERRAKSVTASCCLHRCGLTWVEVNSYKLASWVNVNVCVCVCVC